MSSAPPSRPSTALVAVALLIVYVVWGSTYLGIAIMIETLPPLLAAGVRYTTAGVLMLGGLVAYTRLRRSAAPLERPTRAHWRSAFIVGTLLLLGGNGGVVLAELFIPSGVAAVLISAMVAVVHACHLLGLLPSQFAPSVLFIAVALALRFSYVIARTTLGVPLGVALPVVALDFLLSLTIWAAIDRLA